MNMAQEMLKRIGEGSIKTSVLEQIANMDIDELAQLLEKETFKQEQDSLGLSEFAATVQEIYQLEGFGGVFSKIKKSFKKIATKVKKEAKRVTKKVTKELKRPGIWKAVGAAASFIPGVGPIAATAITAAANTVAQVRTARQEEKELTQQPPQEISYDVPSASDVQQSVSSLTQLATPYTIQSLKAQGLTRIPGQPAANGGFNLMKILPLAAIPLVMLMVRG